MLILSIILGLFNFVLLGVLLVHTSYFISEPRYSARILKDAGWTRRTDGFWIHSEFPTMYTTGDALILQTALSINHSFPKIMRRGL